MRPRIFKIVRALALMAGMGVRLFSAAFPPAFISSGTQTNSALRFDFQATPGFGYVIEAGTNFTDWVFYSSLLADNQRQSFTFPSAGFAPSYFFRLREFGPAPNDQFTNSVELTGAPARALGSNLGATSEPGEPAHGLFNENGKSVWWSWTAPSDGYAYLSAVGTCFDTLLAVYTGDVLTNLYAVARKRSWTKQLAFAAVAGQTYRIAVDGNPDGFQPIRLNLTLTNAPPAKAPASLGDTSIVVNNTSHVSGGERLLAIGKDGQWSEYTYGLTNVPWAGGRFTYTNENSTASLRLISDDSYFPFETSYLDYVFTFVTDSTGFYERIFEEQTHTWGTFSDFRNIASGLAPPSLAGAELQTTNVTSSLGSPGQTHSFTFDASGSYHDSDGQDQAWGNYSYSNDGNTAVAHLQVEGPLLFRGDDYRLRLNFVSAITGSFDGTYVRNDGATVRLTGNFILDYGK